MNTLVSALRAMLDPKAAAKAGPDIKSYLHSMMVKQFVACRKGGTARGVSWAYFKNPWYTRKDGTEVPIWGGVPRADGTGLVKGKKRSKTLDGKKRYTPNSAMMQSTGIMRGALLHDMRISERAIELVTPVEYAVYQNAMREFMYVADGEAGVVVSMIARRMGVDR